MKPSQKTVALWLVLILLFASLFKVFDPGNRSAGINAWGPTGAGYEAEAIRQRLPAAQRDR